MNELTLEQKIIQYLANIKGLTNVGDVATALKDPEYAKILVTGNGLDDEIQNENCNHKTLTNEEIKEVFDNDYK